MTKASTHRRNLAPVFIFMAHTGLFGFVACVTKDKRWLAAQAVVWLIALWLLLRSGRR